MQLITSSKSYGHRGPQVKSICDVLFCCTELHLAFQSDAIEWHSYVQRLVTYALCSFSNQQPSKCFAATAHCTIMSMATCSTSSRHRCAAAKAAIFCLLCLAKAKHFAIITYIQQQMPLCQHEYVGLTIWSTALLMNDCNATTDEAQFWQLYIPEQKQWTLCIGIMDIP